MTKTKTLVLIGLVVHILLDIALILGTWTLLFGCATAVSSTPPPEEVYTFGIWADAQAQIVRQYPDAGDPYTVKPEMFVWIPKNSRFSCGPVASVIGCFTSPNEVRYYGIGALPHESGHAILYKLGDYRWRCSFSGHEEYAEC